MPRKDKRGYFNPDSREIADIVRQIVLYTGNIEPIDLPKIEMCFHCTDLRSDIDNRAVTLTYFYRAG